MKFSLSERNHAYAKSKPSANTSRLINCVVDQVVLKRT